MQCNKHVHFTGWNTSFSFNEKSQYVISLNTSISIDFWKFYRDGCILYLWRYIMTRWKQILYEDQKLSKTTKSMKQLIIERIIGGMHIIHSLLQYKEEVYNDNLKAHIEWRSTLTRQYNRQLICFVGFHLYCIMNLQGHELTPHHVKLLWHHPSLSSSQLPTYVSV